MALHPVQSWLQSILGPYRYRQEVYADVDRTLGAVTSLSPRTDTYTYDDGRTVLLLTLQGTIPITFRGASYNIPVAYWIPHEYPKEPPIAYVVPTASMRVRPSRNIDTSGMCRPDFLEAWSRKSEGCNLLLLTETLQSIFSREPPLYAKPVNQPPPSPSSFVPTRTNGQPRQPPAPPSSNLQQSNQPPPRPPPPQGHSSNTSQSSMYRNTNGYHPIPGPSQGPMPQQPQQPPRPPVPQALEQQRYRQASPVPTSPSRQSSMHVGSPSGHPIGQQQQQQQYMPPRPASTRSLEPQQRNNHYPQRQFSQIQQPQPVPGSSQIPTSSLQQVPAPIVPPRPSGLQPSRTQPLRGYSTPVNILDADDNDDTSTPSTSATPAPARPLNPQLLNLRRTLYSQLVYHLSSLQTHLNTENTHLHALQEDLLKGEPAILDEMARLEAVRDVCASARDRMREVVDSGGRNIEDLRNRPDPEVDELVCGTNVVHNQLLELVAEDNALEDTVYHLGRAFNSDTRTQDELEKFLKRSRALCREQFFKRSLINKILLELALSRAQHQ